MALPLTDFKIRGRLPNFSATNPYTLKWGGWELPVCVYLKSFCDDQILESYFLIIF